MITREQTLQLLSSPQVDPNTMLAIVNEYIFEQKGERLNLGQFQIDPYGLMILKDKYDFALNWFRNKHEIHEVWHGNKLIKIF